MNKSPFLSDLRDHMFTMHYLKRTVDSYVQRVKYFMVGEKKQQSGYP